MRPMFRTVLFQTTGAVTIFSVLACGGPRLADNDARAALDNAFEENSGIHKLPVGRTTVNGGLLGGLQGAAKNELADAPLWKDAGLIELVTYTAGRGSWIESTTFTLSPTEKGVKLQASSIPAIGKEMTKHPSEPSLPVTAKESAVGVWDWSSETLEGMTNGGLYLYARYYALTVGDIIDNQALTDDHVNTFRTVKATLKAKWSDLGLAVCKAHNLPSPDTANLVALFRYDQFKKAWQLVASDITPPDKPAKTEHVAAYLAAAKAGAAVDSNQQWGTSDGKILDF